MGRFENITLDMNVPLKSIKFLLNLVTEGFAGRLGKKDGSFDWKNEKGWELPIEEWEPLVPTHGNFAGPGYSCGKQGQFSRKQIEQYPVAQVYDSRIGDKRRDYVDILAKDHDLAYVDAEGTSYYWEKIHAADRKLVTETQKLLDGTSPLFSDGGKMTPGETAYAESMVDGFKLKLAMMDEPSAAIEKFKNAGYGKKEINDLMNNLTQGIKFLSPQELFHKLDLSGNEIREIEEKYAAYCEENNIQLASASSRYPDEYLDEDQDYYYGPGMGMG
ncbi:MAG: hypothetical protein ACYDHW_01000 [Syntrophorhabdaceae bacterium]